MRRLAYAPARERYPDALTSGFLIAALLASLVVARLSTSPTSLRLAVLGALTCAVLGLGFAAPRGLLFSLVGWLAVLGLIRRVVTLSAGGTGTDPLLLVGPLAVVILLMVAGPAGAFRRPTTLSKAVLILSGLACLGALNPLQGGLRVGLAGLLFVLVPMLSFWVGRGLVTDRILTWVLTLMAGLALPAAGYGLWQTFDGFPRWDERWIAGSHFAALHVGLTVRPFSVFSSPQEFGSFLAIGIVVWLAYGLSLQRIAITLGAVSLLGAALVYESSRTIAILLVAALGMGLAARRGVRLPVALSVGAVFVFGLSFVAAHFAGGNNTKTPSALVAHTAQGLANPFSSGSTAFGHISLVKNGVRDAFTHPVGSGVGAVTIAGSKFSDVNQNTEADPSNAAVALGFPGLVTYLVILVGGLTLVYRLAVRRRDALSVAALGVVVVMTLEWLNGGQYAVAFLPWLVLGWADRQRVDEAESEDSAAPDAPPQEVIAD